MMLKPFTEVPVLMEKLSIKRPTVLTYNTDYKFYVNIFRQTNHFEIFEGGGVVATGSIKKMETYEFESVDDDEGAESEIIMGADFYKQCKLRHLNYKDDFREIVEIDLKKQKAVVKWYERFDCFIDTFLQLTCLYHLNSSDLILPSYIEKLFIDPICFLDLASRKKGKIFLYYYFI